MPQEIYRQLHLKYKIFQRKKKHKDFGYDVRCVPKFEIIFGEN